jgi:hypothetical protein
MKLLTTNTWRAIVINTDRGAFEHFGLWNLFWGSDIFINGVPFIKCLILVNIVVWLILFKG